MKNMPRKKTTNNKKSQVQKDNMKNMPRKKTTNNKKSQVQKQKIAARLLEISFKADDYIYKKKSISVEHAEKYLEEVEKFEPKCQGDVRSLQVIDKLTHLMKSIIEQGRTSQDAASQSSYNPFNITSTNASTTSDTTVKSTRSTHVQTNKSFEIRNIIDYLENTSAVDKNNAVSERMQVVETDVNIDLERTLSNLSLSIIDPVNKEIVENIHNLANIEEINFPTLTIANNIILNKKGNINTRVCDQASKDQIDTNQNGKQGFTTPKTPPNIIMIDLLDDDDNCQPSIVNNKASNIATTDKTIVKHNIDKTKKLDMQVNKINVEKKKDSKTQGEDENKSKRNTKNNKLRKPRRNSKVCFDTISTEEKTENKNKRRRKSTKEIVCDLSWVENIKFVRVIEPSEYDTSLELHESFWENCYLPYDFSRYF